MIRERHQYTTRERFEIHVNGLKAHPLELFTKLDLQVVEPASEVTKFEVSLLSRHSMK